MFKTKQETGTAGHTILKLSTKRSQVFQKKNPFMLKLGSKDPTNHRAALGASQSMAAQFSNISYLKQFTPKKMGVEVLILPNS